MGKTPAMRNRILSAAVGAAFIFLIFVASNSTAQEDVTAPAEPNTTTNSSKALDIRGEVGTFGELYGISGHERRRPSSTGRIFLRSTLTAWNGISASLNLMLSTEGSSARQDINQVDFNPRWRWGEAHLGDFTGELSSLTLSGIRVRGGAVSILPGKLRFSLLSGRTTRSVETTGSGRAYERSLTGVRLGYGREGSSTFDLIVIGARDRLTSLTSPSVDTSTTDTLFGESEQNPLVVTPQENLVVSTATNIMLLQKKLKWRTEIAGSAITRDRRSAELDHTGVPEFLNNLFMPRKSSAADFAYQTDLSLELKQVTLNAGFHRIGPGYVSLGLASLSPDKQEITAGANVRFKRGYLRIDGATQHDNLIDQKSFTTDRLRLGTMLSFRMNKGWNMTAGLMYMGMLNHAPSDTTRVDYANWLIRNGHQFNFNKRSGFRTVSIDMVHQQSSDKNPFRHGSKTSSTSGTITANYGVSGSIDVMPAIGMITSKVGTNGRTLTQTYTLTAHQVMMQRRLRNGASVSVAVGEVQTTIRPSLKSSYDFTSVMTFSAEIDATMVKGGAVGSQFDEIAGRLIFSRKF